MSKFKVGDIVRITNPVHESRLDKDKVGQINYISPLSYRIYPISVKSRESLEMDLFREEELSLIPKEELPLWQLRFTTLK